MSRSYILVAEAQREFDDSVDYYERQQIGLGFRFLTAVRDTPGRVAANPEMYAVVHRDFREAPVSGFPFCVYYRVKPTTIRVLSVFHTSRDPSIWQGRR